MLAFLRKCEKPKTRKQIADAMLCDPIKVSHILKDLLRWDEVKFIEYDRNEASVRVGYMLLRRTKFFFVEEE